MTVKGRASSSLVLGTELLKALYLEKGKALFFVDKKYEV